MFVRFAALLATEVIFPALREILPSVSIGLYEEVIAADLEHLPEVAFSVEFDASNFPTIVNFAWFLGGVPPSDIFIELARQLSIKFQCQTVCEPGSYSPTDSPYWVIVWDKNQAFLGDDIDLDSEGTGVINILSPLAVPAADLQSLLKKCRSDTPCPEHSRPQIEL